MIIIVNKHASGFSVCQTLHTVVLSSEIFVIKGVTMDWLGYALATAFFDAVKNIFNKKLLGPVDPFSVAFIGNLVVLPVLWAAALATMPVTIHSGFWTTIGHMIIPEMIVMVLMPYAMLHGELSASFPFISFYPFFITLGGHYKLGEHIGLGLWLGVALMSVGAFVLGWMSDKKSHFVFKGALYMFSVAALWGYLVPMGKIAIGYSSPQFFAAMYWTIMIVAFYPVYRTCRKMSFEAAWKHKGVFILLGLSGGVFVVLNWVAYAKGPVGKVSAIVLFVVPFTQALARWVLKEKQALRRLWPALLMVAGGAITYLWH